MIVRVSRHLIEDFIRNISGSLGFKLRYWYYRKRLNSCGKKIYIDTGVYFTNPKMIDFGDYVWIDKNVHLIAGKLEKTYIKVKKDTKVNLLGRISIGSNVHIGLNTIIQGHGGVNIGDYFTTSANCKIYSMSNNVHKCKHGTFNDSSHTIYYIYSPIEIGNNVWLGLNVSILGGKLEDNIFIKPNSVVNNNITKNSIVGGFPAKFVKQRFDEIKGN